MPSRHRCSAPPLLALLLLVAGAACGEAPGAAESPGSPTLPPRTLVPQLFFTHDSLGSPRALAVAGDLLVVGDGRGLAPLWILSRAGPERRLPFGRRGEGPGEFRSVWSITPEPEGEAVWVYDLGLRRMSRVELRDETPQVTSAFVVKLEQTLTGPAPLSDSTFVSPGLLQRGRVAEIDTLGRLLRTFGEVPPGDPAVPVHVRQHAYQSTLAVKPDRSRFVLATRHADRLEIYAADGRLVRTVKGPRGFAPVYRVKRRGREDGMETGADLRFGYVSLAVTDRWIFALYSGLRRADRPGRANFGDLVHVYDWDGVLRHVLKLQSVSISIAADPGGRTLYAAREDPVPAILRYPLPAL